MGRHFIITEVFPTFQLQIVCCIKIFHFVTLHRVIWILQKIVITIINWSEIVQNFNDGSNAGYFGIVNTYARVIELFYWPGHRKSIYAYVKKCPIMLPAKVFWRYYYGKIFENKTNKVKISDKTQLFSDIQTIAIISEEVWKQLRKLIEKILTTIIYENVVI